MAAEGFFYFEATIFRCSYLQMPFIHSVIELSEWYIWHDMKSDFQTVFIVAFLLRVTSPRQYINQRSAVARVSINPPAEH